MIPLQTGQQIELLNILADVCPPLELSLLCCWAAGLLSR